MAEVEQGTVTVVTRRLRQIVDGARWVSDDKEGRRLVFPDRRSALWLFARVYFGDPPEYVLAILTTITTFLETSDEPEACVNSIMATPVAYSVLTNGQRDLLELLISDMYASVLNRGPYGLEPDRRGRLLPSLEQELTLQSASIDVIRTIHDLLGNICEERTTTPPHD